MKFEWFFEEDEFQNAQISTVEDDIYGFVCIQTDSDKYIVDIHKEYYNSKNNGYDLEVYRENKDGGRGIWVASLKEIKSVTSMCDPFGKFKSRAEKLLAEFLRREAA